MFICKFSIKFDTFALFNISSFIFASFILLQVRWSTGSPTSPSFIFNNGQTELGFQVIPREIPQNSPEDGNVSLIVNQLPSSYYSNSDSQKVWFQCQVFTVHEDINNNMIHTRIQDSIEISIVGK